MGDSKGSPCLSISPPHSRLLPGLRTQLHSAPDPGVGMSQSPRPSIATCFLSPLGMELPFSHPPQATALTPDPFPQMAAPSSVEGLRILGTGNLVISDVSVQHLGVYVCAPNQSCTCVPHKCTGTLPGQCPPGPGRKGLGTLSLEGRGQEGWVSVCLPHFLTCPTLLACLVATVSPGAIPCGAQGLTDSGLA